MKVIVPVLVALILQLSQATDVDSSRKNNSQSEITKRSTSTTPPQTCNRNNEGDSIYNPTDPSTVWICKNSVWKPYRIVPSAGQTREFSARSCKEITEVLPFDCPQSGVYWVQGQKIYCDMKIDGGGWTLVWQHTYMKFRPLHSNMFYFSDHNRPCVKDASEEYWCNVPNKARFNPTEQMIVAYHKGKIVYAYKGYFNGNIDQRWQGGILIHPKKVVDLCTRYNGIPPAPSVHISGIFGLSFDKQTPSNFYWNCDTYGRATMTKLDDCRWHDCRLPSSISSKDHNTDMTMAIFVR